jgi:MFS family permease
MNSFQLKLPGYMVYCVFVASLGSFCNGWVTGSANVPGEATHACINGAEHVFNKAFPDCLPMDNALWGFAVASFSVGGLVGGFIGGGVQTKFGRKKTIIFNNIFWILGGILISVSVNSAMFIVGRILCGFSCGINSLATPTYVGEIATVKARGTMGTCHQFSIVSGILLATVIGLPLANVPLWRLNYAIVAIPGIVQFFMMYSCVESPRYLISINRIEEARENLQKLRSNANIDDEFFGMVEGQVGTAAVQVIVGRKTDDSDTNKSGNKNGFEDTQVEKGDINHSEDIRKSMNMIQIFKDPLIRHITLIALAIHAIQQLIGMNVLMYYSTIIFNTSFDGQMSMYLAIITTVINFVFTILCMFLVDRVGRRLLLLIAEAGTCIFSVLLIVGYVYKVGPLLIVTVFGFVISIAMGIGSIPWMLISEITPVYASSSVGAVGTAMNWAMNFLIGQCFPIIFQAIQIYAFAIFVGVAAIAFVFTYFMVPETKGSSIEEIVQRFEKRL